MLQFLSGVWLAYMGSGLRCWEHAMEAWGKTLPILAGVMTDDTPEARAILLDELRGRLRELVEYPQHESRRLQAELDRIAATIWPAATGETDGPYWRRWNAKP